MAKRNPTTEELTTALIAARNELARLRQVFAHPNFTDRHDDAGTIKRVVAFINDTLDGKRPDASDLPVQVA